MLGPEDILSKRFKVRRASKGYDPEEVDAFLDLLAEDMKKLYADCATFQVDNDRLRRDASNEPTVVQSIPVSVVQDPQPVLAVVPRDDTQLTAESAGKLLVVAQRAADEMVRQAQVDADSVAVKVRDDADRYMMDQRIAAANLVRDAEVTVAGMQQKIQDLTTQEAQHREYLKAALGKLGAALGPALNEGNPA